MYEKLSKATKGITQDLDLGIETFVSLGGLRDFKIIDTSFVVLNE
jgi:hypothetical protein